MRGHAVVRAGGGQTRMMPAARLALAGDRASRRDNSKKRPGACG
jgi:hypothetical protein